MVPRGGLALLLLASLNGAAELQDPRPGERGYPLMRSFEDSDYQSGSQNFAVAVDQGGRAIAGGPQNLLALESSSDG